MADSGRPEALECFRVLAPRLNDDVQTRSALNGHILQKFKDRVGLIVDQECERNDKALVRKRSINRLQRVLQEADYLQERGSLGGEHSSHHSLQQLWQDWQDRLSSSSQQVDDQIANYQTT